MRTPSDFGEMGDSPTHPELLDWLAREFVEGGETPQILAAAGAPRHLLHCARLVVAQPATGRPLAIEAPLPPDFEAAWGGPLGSPGASSGEET